MEGANGWRRTAAHAQQIPRSVALTEGKRTAPVGTSGFLGLNVVGWWQRMLSGLKRMKLFFPYILYNEAHIPSLLKVKTGSSKYKHWQTRQGRFSFFFFERESIGKVLPCPLHTKHTQWGRRKFPWSRHWTAAMAVVLAGWGLDSWRLVLRDLITDLLANADNSGVCLRSNQNKYFH